MKWRKEEKRRWKRGEASPESTEQKLRSKRSIEEYRRSSSSSREAYEVRLEKEMRDINTEKIEEQWISRSEEIMIELLRRFNKE